jgi:hypothetical protein
MTKNTAGKSYFQDREEGENFKMKVSEVGFNCQK